MTAALSFLHGRLTLPMDDLWPRDGVNLRIDEPCGRACILLVDSIVPLERPNDEGNDGKGANFMSTKNLTFIFPMRLKVLHGCYWRTWSWKMKKRTQLPTEMGYPGRGKMKEMIYSSRVSLFLWHAIPR